MEIGQYDIYLINLDPTIGSEIKKTRPCVVLSPDEMNRNIQTIIIAPMTTHMHSYPTRVPLTFQKKTGWIVLDQIRTIDRRRLIKKLGHVSENVITKIKTVIKEMLVD
ncbi:MAG: type II toxin-antitoxin system PemK/MazF family toxin [Candidatus Brocadiaceae bacterium]|nr:type II toxin-antitoxin system PemK/MazF family toxin [Candidatus Brocadiaceae bacterium]